MTKAIFFVLIFISEQLYAQCRPGGKYDGVLFTLDDKDASSSLWFMLKGKHSLAQRGESGALVCFFSKPDSVGVRDIVFADNNYVVDAGSVMDMTVKGKCIKALKLIKVYGLEVSSDRKLVFQVNKGQSNSTFITTDAIIDVPVSEKRTFTTTLRKDFVYFYEVNIKSLISKGKKEEQDETRIKMNVDFKKKTDREQGLMSSLFGDENLGVKRITYQIIDK